MTRPSVGFVGLGWIGSARLRTIAESGRAEVAALCESREDRLAPAARLYPKARAFSRWEELLDDSKGLALDGVVIATPNALHAGQTHAALECGLSVLCQKPLGLTATEVRRVLEMGRRADRLLAVDYSYRFLRSAREMKRLIGRGELGDVFHLEGVFHNAYGPDKPWCYDVSLSGGGAFLDLGIHLVDLVRWLLEGAAVLDVRARTRRKGRWAPSAATIEDFAAVDLCLAPDVAARVTVSWEAHTGQDCLFRVLALGTEGGAEIRNRGGSFYDFELVRFRGRTAEVVAGDDGRSLGRASLDWVDRLARSPRFSAEIESAAVTAEIVDQVYRRH